MSVADVRAILASIEQDMPRESLHATASKFEELAQRLYFVMADTGDQDMLGAAALLKHLDDSCMQMHQVIGDVCRTVDEYAARL